MGMQGVRPGGTWPMGSCFAGSRVERGWVRWQELQQLWEAEGSCILQLRLGSPET